MMEMFLPGRRRMQQAGYYGKKGHLFQEQSQDENAAGIPQGLFSPTWALA